MKILVSTNGNFMLRSTNTGEEAAWNRISLVTSCNFFGAQIADGTLKLWGSDIPDTTTDADWAKWLSEAGGDEALAVASFLSQFQPQTEIALPAPKPKKQVPATTPE